MPEFEAFVVFAEMRTGSNFLEVNLNASEEVRCLGEVFNPYFIGYPNKKQVLGLTREQRDEHPLTLLDRICHADGMNGFRYFHDHDPRVLDAILDNPRIAKVILTRRPVDSYVSWKIAQETGQWKLTNTARRRTTKARFDASEFENYLDAILSFQAVLRRKLQERGQTAFHIAYDELNSRDVINGMLRFFGTSGSLKKLDNSLKVQNPGAVRDKVSNPSEIEVALQKYSQVDISLRPEFEPPRAAMVPTYVAAVDAPVLYMPLKSGLETAVVDWLAGLDGADDAQLRRDFNQKSLKQWKRSHPGHLSFTVVRHPVARAHSAFCKHFLGTGAIQFTRILSHLKQRYGLAVPEDGVDLHYDLYAHRRAFMVFLAFLQENLSGQTAIRVDGAWCSQSEALRGFGGFAFPDRIFREDDLADDLSALAAKLGYADAPRMGAIAQDTPFRLSDVYTPEIEARVSEIYQKDFMMFGFEPWSQ